MLLAGGGRTHKNKAFFYGVKGVFMGSDYGKSKLLCVWTMEVTLVVFSAFTAILESSDVH
jgi:hypothetical protein